MKHLEVAVSDELQALGVALSQQLLYDLQGHKDMATGEPVEREEGGEEGSNSEKFRCTVEPFSKETSEMRTPFYSIPTSHYVFWCPD